MNFYFLKRIMIVPFLIVFVNSPCSGPEVKVKTYIGASGLRVFEIVGKDECAISAIGVKRFKDNVFTWKVQVADTVKCPIEYGQKFAEHSDIKVEAKKLVKNEKYEFLINMYNHKVSSLIFIH